MIQRPNPVLVPVTEDEEKQICRVANQYERLVGLRGWRRHTGGRSNKTFVIRDANQRFVLRQSNCLVTPEHLSLEVEVLLYLENVGYKLSPRLIPNKDGEYVTRHQRTLYTMQTFMPGRARVTMDEVREFKGSMLTNFFEAIADFTRTVQGFVPRKSYSNQPLAEIVEGSNGFIESAIGNVAHPGQEILLQNKNILIDFLSTTSDQLKAVEYDKLPKQLIHFDIHPGNVHFAKSKVVGVFDYDSVRFDTRFSEIASSLAMSCHRSRGEYLVMEKVDKGIVAYQEKYGANEFDVAFETRILRVALRAAILAHTIWAVDWYMREASRPDALMVLHHWVNMAVWANHGPGLLSLAER